MTQSITALAITAASVGVIHTLLGPDHYLPFVALSRSERWSLWRTGFVTFYCGLGHILGAVFLGAIGILLGYGTRQISVIESIRGDVAAWALIAFGLVYFVWGLRKAAHKDEHAHDHEHVLNPHHDRKAWILFIIFAFGPCEPLIPLIMVPAALGNLMGVVWITVIFGATTLLTMLSVVFLTTWGVNLLPMGKLERYTTALAGFTIFLCGAAIKFLGL
ncbi:MAG: sulfite exporter TauE/SafE family protein [Elusimicrobia bacterium]|nr:sulfite exporter TauE/SafE family protein [Candidatus Obscuribacterium magneticum]